LEKKEARALTGGARAAERERNGARSSASQARREGVLRVRAWLLGGTGRAVGLAGGEKGKGVLG